MTSTPPEAPPGAPGPGPDADQDGPRVTRDEVRDLGRLRRTTDDRRVAGVAGGLARHLDIDPVILRVAFVVLAFFGGAGLVLYGACWLLVPADDRDRAPIALDERTRGLALGLVGVLGVLILLGDSWGDRQWLGWPLVAVGILVLLALNRRSSGAEHPAQPAPPFAPPFAEPFAQPVAQPSATSPAYAPVPRAPRRRGPVLFWFTLALVALVEGLLGIVDLAGVPVADPAYPALAVATIGAMLVVGAFYGRPGGLVLAGLVASLALGVTTAAQGWQADTLHSAPLRAAGVHDSYRITTGELVLDLRRVGDLAALDGRTVRLRGDVGRLEVRVPDGLDVDVRGSVDGPGDVTLFGVDHNGVDVNAGYHHSGGPGSPALTLDAGLDVGQIEVTQ